MVNLFSSQGVFKFPLPKWCHNGKIEAEYDTKWHDRRKCRLCVWEILLDVQYVYLSPSSDNNSGEQEAVKFGEIWDEIYSVCCNTKRAHIILCWNFTTPHLGGNVLKISALPRHRDRAIQGSEFNWTGKGRRGEPGDNARGGWGRIYDLSIFPSFAGKQDCWLSACRDEWSSY